MLLPSTVLYLSTLLNLINALPTPAPSHLEITYPTTHLLPRSALPDAASQLLAIAPTSSSCTNPPAANECATASQAAAPLIAAFSRYGITNPWEIASVLSLIAFETADFKYNINHYPGTPGQGTRNMQMGSYNLQYAKSIPELARQVSGIVGANGGGADMSSETANQVRDLVTTDQYTWGSAAWFLTTQCQSVRGQVQQGGQQGFQAYMGCVGTSATSERLAYFTRAMGAFGLS